MSVRQVSLMFSRKDDDPAGALTVTATALGGTVEFRVDDAERYELTPRECAMLRGFLEAADEYVERGA